MTAKIFVTGEALIDFVPINSSQGSAFAPRCGGSSYNVAKASALQGANVEFIGPISTDLFGDHLTTDLCANGVGLSHSKRVSNPTTLAFVEFQNNEPRYAFFNAQSATQMTDHSSTCLNHNKTDIIHAGSISLIDEPGGTNIFQFVKTCAESSILSLDPNARQTMIVDIDAWRRRIEALIEVASIVKLSDEDLAILRPGQTPETFLEDLKTKNVDIGLVTLGAKGCMATTQMAKVSTAGYSGVFEDTVGCGDTVTGTILAELIGHSRAEISSIGQDKLLSLVKRAIAAAWLNAQQSGCRPPNKQNIDQFLKQSN